MLQEDLISRARRHCAERGISLSRLATIVVNDGKFFQRLERGSSCTLKTYERFIIYLAQQEALENHRLKSQGKSRDRSLSAEEAIANNGVPDAGF